MFKKSAIFAGLALFAAASAQAEYNAEVGAAIAGGDGSAIALHGTYYLDTVDDSKGPFGEATFIDRSSFIGIAASDGEDDNDFGNETYGIGGRYITQDAGWILGLAYERLEPETAIGTAEIDAYSLELGKYIAEHTTLVLGYGFTDTDSGGEVDTYSLDVEHLFNWGDSGLKLAGGYAYSETDDDGNDVDVYSVGATWYPCKNFGIGADYSLADAGEGDVDTYSVGAEYFITQDVSVTAAYVETEVDDSDLESDAYTIGVTARF